MATTHDDKVRDLVDQAGQVELRSYVGGREWVLQRSHSDKCRVTGGSFHENKSVLYEGCDFERAVAVAHEFMLTGKLPA